MKHVAEISRSRFPEAFGEAASSASVKSAISLMDYRRHASMLSFHNKSRFSGVLKADLTCRTLPFAKYCPEIWAACGEPARNTDVAAPLSGEREKGSAA